MRSRKKVLAKMHLPEVMIVAQMSADEQADQRRRLETLGRMAGYVVHDFNNLLMVVEGYARLLLEDPGLSVTARDNLGEILQASERAAELTGQLLAFSRNKPLQPVGVDVVQVVQALQPLLKRIAGENIELKVELPQGAVRILSVPGRLEQVVLNLVVNAREALPAGGSVAVRVRHAGGKVELEVEDSGAGVPEELRGKIFEPFFSTKGAGAGAGIGLALVAEVVAEWGGRLRWIRPAGRGFWCRFRRWCWLKRGGGSW